MPASTTVAAFIVALRSQLQARSGLSGVPVHLIIPGDLAYADSVILVREKIEGTQEYAALGRLRREDTPRIPGLVRAYKAAGAAGAQDSDSQFQAAIERAAALVDEVILQLRDSPPAVGNQTIVAMVEDIAYLPFPSDKGGWCCDCEFSVTYRARIS